MIGLPHGVLDLVIRLKQAEMTVVGRNPMSIGQALSVWSQRVAGVSLCDYISITLNST